MVLRDAVLAQLRQRGPGWVTARELACEIGCAWQPVARLLSTLAEVERRTVYWVSSRHRPRDRMEYRLLADSFPAFPAWLMPDAKAITRLFGGPRV